MSDNDSNIEFDIIEYNENEIKCIKELYVISEEGLEFVLGEHPNYEDFNENLLQQMQEAADDLRNQIDELQEEEDTPNLSDDETTTKLEDFNYDIDYDSCYVGQNITCSVCNFNITHTKCDCKNTRYDLAVSFLNILDNLIDLYSRGG